MEKMKTFKLRYNEKVSAKNLSTGSYFSLEVKDSPSYQVINKRNDSSFDVRRVAFCVYVQYAETKL